MHIKHFFSAWRYGRRFAVYPGIINDITAVMYRHYSPVGPPENSTIQTLVKFQDDFSGRDEGVSESCGTGE
jgi:hypothetical protein